MSKFTVSEYASTKEILKFPDHYVAMAVLVSDTGVVADAYGKKIVPKGTIVGGAENPVLDNLDEAVVDKYVPPTKAYLVAGTAGANSSVLFEALAAGTEGNSISITITDPGTTSQELAVSVSDGDITIALGTDENGDENSTAEEVAAAVNANADAKLLVKATAGGDGKGVVAAKTKTSLANGADYSATGAEGVLMNDVDVTYGPRESAMIIHGFIAIDKLPYGDGNSQVPAAVGNLLPAIKFIK
jgi:hypothetical protein